MLFMIFFIQQYEYFLFSLLSTLYALSLSCLSLFCYYYDSSFPSIFLGFQLFTSSYSIWNLNKKSEKKINEIKKIHFIAEKGAHTHTYIKSLIRHRNMQHFISIWKTTNIFGVLSSQVWVCWRTSIIIFIIRKL